MTAQNTVTQYCVVLQLHTSLRHNGAIIIIRCGKVAPIVGPQAIRVFETDFGPCKVIANII